MLVARPPLNISYSHSKLYTVEENKKKSTNNNPLKDLY